MTREEFAEYCSKKIGMSLLDFVQSGLVPTLCDCGKKECKGWIMSVDTIVLDSPTVTPSEKVEVIAWRDKILSQRS